MRSEKKIALSFSLLIGLTACQKTASNNGSSTLFSSGLTEVCQDAGQDTGASLQNNSAVSVTGSSTATVGQTVVYRVNKTICNTNNKVSWNLGDSKTLQTNSNSVTSQFAAPGKYFVSAKINDLSSQSITTAQSVQNTIVISNSPALSGPQVVLNQVANQYAVIIPAQLKLTTISWSFGDGTSDSSNKSVLSHSYSQPGLYELVVNARDEQNKLYILNSTINVFASQTQVDCASQAAISSPSEGKPNTSAAINGFIPSCLSADMTGFTFDFGDGTSSSSLNNSHTYLNQGQFKINFDIQTIFQDKPGVPYLRLSQSIQIIEEVIGCGTIGATKETLTDSYEQSAACGVNGSKIQTYKARIIEQCTAQQNTSNWVEISRTPVLQSEGACLKQSCILPDQSNLADGASKTFYISTTAHSLCSSESLVRVCSNGVLSGSSSYSYLTCKNGCGDFGKDGTTKSSIIIGEIKSDVTCPFGETGIFNIYNQQADQTCRDGQIVNSNIKQGSLKQSGQCPIYQWKATENWTTCSADCGGSQSRIYQCVDEKGNSADSSRCSIEKPTETRLCDGNPSAVARTDKVTTEEDAGSSASCPKNQIGVIVQTRNKIVSTNYACVNHQVQKASESVEYSAWETHKYCRDYVAHRCSQDSLDNTQAQGRYKWMVKCQNEVPVIKEFLVNFDGVEGNNKFTIDSKSRVLYPTFMMRTSKGQEKPWIAPVAEKTKCDVPASIYVAAVCVSSCATPEQQILVEAKEDIKKLKYMSFIDALTENKAAVATLGSTSSIHSKQVQVTRVEQWVTELLDTEHLILEFHMKSGKSLRLTPNHPVVTVQGTIQLAENFKAGDSLVQLGGHADQIKEIKQMKYFGKVYNLFVKSSNPLENIVVTNGYLNGTAFFQNEGAQNLNKVLLRKKLTQGVFSHEK